MNNNQQQRPEASAQPTVTPPRKTLVSVLFRRWRREVSSDLRPDRETRAIASMKIMVFANVMLILALIGLLLPVQILWLLHTHWLLPSRRLVIMTSSSGVGRLSTVIPLR